MATRTQANSCGVCGWQRGTGIGLYGILPPTRYYHSSITVHPLFTRPPQTLYTYSPIWAAGCALKRKPASFFSKWLYVSHKEILLFLPVHEYESFLYFTSYHRLEPPVYHFFCWTGLKNAGHSWWTSFLPTTLRKDAVLLSKELRLDRPQRRLTHAHTHSDICLDYCKRMGYWQHIWFEAMRYRLVGRRFGSRRGLRGF